MDNSRGDGQWSDWSGDEDEFRQTLLGLEIEGESNKKKTEILLRSPFVLGLLKKVTNKNQLRTAKGSRTPEFWWAELQKDPDVREEWRCETVVVLGQRLREKPDGCDNGKNVGGYWRMKVVYAAIRAAWNLLGERGFRPRYDPESQKRVVPIKCFGECGQDKAHERHEDKRAAADLTEMDFRLDIAMLVDGLKDPRQRAVMRLSAVEGYNYREIAAKLRISFEQVRYAVEQARKVLTPQVMDRNGR